MKRIKLLLVKVILLLFMLNIYAQEKTDEEMLIGRWLCIEDSNSVIEFTIDGKCYWYYTGEDTDVYNYTFSKEKSESGVIFTDIILINIEDSNYKEEYTISNINKHYLQLEYTNPREGNYFFERIDSRVKPKESKPKPSSELEEESEPLLHWGFKLSDYDRGYFDGGVAYQQCKEEQDKEDRDIFDRHRLMPIEGMEWESKAPKLGLGDCREEAFERIKMSTKEYQDGFEKGWRDASMPLNKEKETTKKK